jgi:hypothetical protein
MKSDGKNMALFARTEYDVKVFDMGTCRILPATRYRRISCDASPGSNPQDARPSLRSDDGAR